jgi:hypothetical protein
MKLNTQCVLKYLKHDYKEIVTSPLTIFIACLVVALVVGINFFHGVPEIKIDLPSPYMMLNVFAAITVLMLTVGIAAFGDKEWFEYKPWKEGYGWGKNDCKTKGYEVFFIPAFAVGVCLYGFYLCGYVSYSGWGSPLISATIYTLLILIGTPIGCAIAKCKGD